MLVKLYQCLAILSLVVLISCYPKGAEYAEELDLVLTNYSSGYDFQAKTTYSMPDSVIKITGDVFNDPDGNGKPQFLSAEYSTVILSQIQQNMAANGWTLVNKGSNPDVVLLVSAMTTTNVYYYYDWSYWDWWYPAEWGWYYPEYYYPSYVSGYRTGSIFIQMADVKNVPQGENVAVPWNCILNGLAEGGSTNMTTRVQNGLNKAFAQSPYLKH
jgi:hypothetical protein